MALRASGLTEDILKFRKELSTVISRHIQDLTASVDP